MAEAHTQDKSFLPLGYNDNRITLLPRDPHWLFAYWEVSEDKKSSFFQQFGETLWKNSIPVLKVTNINNSTSFYIKINDYANNWYINVPDANCIYMAELGRKVSEEFFISLASSNSASTPGNSISANTTVNFVNYNELRGTTQIPDGEKAYEAYHFKSHSTLVTGPSSPEMFGMEFEEFFQESMEESFIQSMLGISSMELLGGGLAKHLGISSWNLGVSSWNLGISSWNLVK